MTSSLRCVSTIAARCAIVMFAESEPAIEPDSRLLKASPPPGAPRLCVGFVSCGAVSLVPVGALEPDTDGLMDAGAYEGVIERELDDELGVDASMANTSLVLR